MTGLDFAFQIKEKFPDKFIPFAILTSWTEREAHVFKDLEAKGKALGVIRIIPKDLEQNELEKIILKLIT